mmetsp:Transcript_7160/g.9291  ORF Transcript_7160/g.9291 Transcript_7160/m.9291 type:complete len:100 (+) Transcript_7160:181-480(+)
MTNQPLNNNNNSSQEYSETESIRPTLSNRVSVAVWQHVLFEGVSLYNVKVSFASTNKVDPTSTPPKFPSYRCLYHCSASQVLSRLFAFACYLFIDGVEG